MYKDERMFQWANDKGLVAAPVAKRALQVVPEFAEYIYSSLDEENKEENFDKLKKGCGSCWGKAGWDITKVKAINKKLKIYNASGILDIKDGMTTEERIKFRENNNPERFTEKEKAIAYINSLQEDEYGKIKVAIKNYNNK